MRRTLAPIVVAMVAASATSGTASADSNNGPLISVPSRPFFLIGADRRFSPSKPAFALVEKKGERRVEMSIYRVLEPTELLRDPLSTPGVAVAASPMGMEMESLAERGGAYPRVGKKLSLVRQFPTTLDRKAKPRRIFDETVAYDSNEAEETDVATYWVNPGRWSSSEVNLGRLRRGLYVVRASAGSWATSSLLSVGELVVVVRRGDTRDMAWVTRADGAPVPGAPVSVFAGTNVVHAGVTDTTGAISFPASDRASLRIIAHHGDDIAWVDGGHRRLSSACDPRIYMAIGRPIYRRGETMHVRGNVRVCADDGYQAKAGVSVKMRSGESSASVVTDPKGNFVAELVADGDIEAIVLGKTHRRAVALDGRALPSRELVISVSPSHAGPGQRVRVTVSDQSGGWPRRASVSLTTPVGTLKAPISPGRAAAFSFVVPKTTTDIVRAPLHASLADGGRVTLASSELWYGKATELVEVTSDRSWSADGRVRLDVRVKALDGSAAHGPVAVRVFGSDGNRKRGRPRLVRPLSVVAGHVQTSLTLPGTGPWWIEAERGSKAVGSAVVWQRPKPPTLDRRGNFAVQPRLLDIQAGERLKLEVRVPAAGWVLLTLEQSGVLAHQWLPPSRSPVRRAELEVPADVRGRTTVVATRIAAGSLQRAEARVDVETSAPFHLVTSTDRAVYREGDTATVTLVGTGEHGVPRDAVVSVWVADAGYWELGDDDYPGPGEFFRLMGWAASASDSTRVLAYGAEEGRRLDTELLWNGKAVARASFRHGWGYGGDLVDLDAKGAPLTVANKLARAAGLRRARVCATVADAPVALRARNLPWDLVAARMADQLELTAVLEGRVLNLSCEPRGSLGHGSGFGSGYGSGSGKGGRRGGKRSLLGTVFFRGKIELGADGKAVVHVPMPLASGRWRVEALAITSDGGGDSASAIVRTERPLFASIDTVGGATVGDRFEARVRIRAPKLARQELVVSPRLSGGLAHLGTPPTKVVVGPAGVVEFTMNLSARAVGPAALSVMLTAVDPASRGVAETVTRSFDIAGLGGRVPLATTVAVGSSVEAVQLALPELDGPGILTVKAAGDLSAELTETLGALRRPRWDVPVMHLDSLRSLAAIERAASTSSAAVKNDIKQAREGRLAALKKFLLADGGLPLWSSRSSLSATAELLWLAPPADSNLTLTRDYLVRRARKSLPHSDAALVSAALSRLQSPQAQRLGRKHLGKALASNGGLVHALWVARAARGFGDRSALAIAHQRIAVDIDRLVTVSEGQVCGGHAWYACFASESQRSHLAQGAIELEFAGAQHRPLVARVVAELSRTMRGETHPLVWGSDAAQVLELLARWRPTDSSKRGYQIKIGAGPWKPLPKTGRVRVSSGDGILSVRGRRPGLLRVSGALAVKAPKSNIGSVELARDFRRTQTGWVVHLAVTTDVSLDAVDIDVPLPAGLEWTQPASTRGGDGSFDERRGWPGWFSATGRQRPRIDRVDRSVRVRWKRLPRGTTAVDVPLAASSIGSFRVGSASLRSANGSWALTPDTVLTTTRP